MKHFISRFGVFCLLVTGILAVFLIRTMLAFSGNPARLNDVFTIITLCGSLLVLFVGYRDLHRTDWLVSVVLGLCIGTGMFFSTLFSPYPFLGIVHTNPGQGIVRGFGTMLAVLCGLVIMRRGGPIQFDLAKCEWRKFGINLFLGLALGAPLAVLNVFVLQLTQGQSINWQNPLSALVDAIQPGIVEEVIYRFAFLGLLWLALNKSIPKQAAWLSGLLALLVHNFMHFDDLFVQDPLIAIGMGLVLALLWGLVPTILALRRDIESAMGFHWIQDAARFLTGF